MRLITKRITVMFFVISMIAMSFSGYIKKDESIINKITSTKYVEPKNVILMIGDGMGKAEVEACLYIEGATLDGKLAMQYLPNQGEVTTYSADSVITDSAAAGTALATGYKTKNGTLGMSPNLESIQNVLELASSLGKKTGIVTTKEIDDATPAAFTAHVNSRGSKEEIDTQQIANCPDVIFGGGLNNYTEARNKTEEELYNELATNNISLITTEEQMFKCKKGSGKIMGLFCKDNFFEPGLKPSLQNMTKTAISLLSNEEKGFFLMVEGGCIDTNGHLNDLYAQAKNTKDFDESVAIAMKYVSNHPDTILIVTADHETGGLIMRENPEDYSVPFYFTTNNHTETNVGIFAVGYGTEIFNGVIVNNTDVAKFIAKSMGIENFGDPKADSYSPSGSFGEGIYGINLPDAA